MEYIFEAQKGPDLNLPRNFHEVQLCPDLELPAIHLRPRQFQVVLTMSSRLLTTLLIITMMAYSSAQTPTATTDSREDIPPNRWMSRDGKLMEPYFQPINNIQIGGCCKPNNTAATDDLLNLTRNILDLLQNQEQHPTRRPISVAGRPRDCSEIQTGGGNISGVYPIYPDGDGDPFFVYCDMETDGGGWTVFQHREDGSVDFFLYWLDYKYGFGSVSSEHWLGNDKIYRLTTQKTYELRVDIEDFEGETRYATYNNFRIENEAANYGLTLGNYSGDAGDSMLMKDQFGKQPFSTRDRDNDSAGWLNCAHAFTGAWWYGTCHESNLNGLYLNGTTTERATSMVWLRFQGHYYSLKKSEMKIRPV